MHITTEKVFHHSY